LAKYIAQTSSPARTRTDAATVVMIGTTKGKIAAETAWLGA